MICKITYYFFGFTLVYLYIISLNWSQIESFRVMGPGMVAEDAKGVECCSQCRFMACEVYGVTQCDTVTLGIPSTATVSNTAMPE